MGAGDPQGASPACAQHGREFGYTTRMQIPSELPISALADELVETIRKSPVTIVCGDTGSGKTTQLPKLAAMACPQARGLIGVTQPRRLAAVAMARRLAEELHSPLGAKVGYKHRFERKTSPSTKFVLMTDGILLAETRDDPLLKRYAVIMIDEAHERSLNIDFLLGILKRILPRRPDLRVIVSSATLDAGRFSEFFDGAPTVSVPGRLYPIETRWEPDPEGEDGSLPAQVADAVDRLGPESGDILVFLPGEREIRETREILEGRRLPRTEILPLLASLPPGEQARAFRLSAGRRIILATNVAETSVTIPGIRCVIDSGLARLKRYSPQRHVQLLRVEPISQASARQRMGRCGRVGPGICVRLYGEEDYARREPHTPPEIRRSALAGVILSMAALRLGRIEAFPFIDPPAGAAVREGYRELLELGALRRLEKRPGEEGETPGFRLTGIGRALADFPLEPRFARILLAAESEQSLRDALTVVAAMACEDPLLRPSEKREAAEQAHARFRTANSDFNGRLKLWAWYHDASLGVSESQRRRRCKAAFISYPRMREWQHIRAQLEELCAARRFHTDDARGGEIGLHRALLTGLLSRIGHWDVEAREYRGAFAARFALFPGSGVARAAKKEGRRPDERPPQPRRPRPDELPLSRDWVMAGELTETSRLFARSVACIDPRWIEPLAGDLCKVRRHSPSWDAAHGFARIVEDVTLFGLPIASGRRRDLSRIDPALAREIFIADGLATPEGLPHPPPWLKANWDLQRVLELRLALRRTAVDDLRAAVRAFYAGSLPEGICSADGLRRCPPLPLQGDAFRADDSATRDFPDAVNVAGETFPLRYRHEPGAPDDGVTIEATPRTLHLLADWHGEWLVPGFLPEKILWMLNALPSRVRHVLGALPDVQGMILDKAKPYARPLSETLYRLLRDEKGVRVDETPWEEARLPAHLRLNYRVVDRGKVLGEGRLLRPLIDLFAADCAERAVARPEAIADPALARIASRRACVAALRAMGAERCRASAALPSLPQRTKAFVKAAGIDVTRLAEELFVRAVERCFLSRGLPETEADLKARYSVRKGFLAQETAALRRSVLFILNETARLEAEVSAAVGVYPETASDILDQLAWLVFDGFVAAVPPDRLERYPLWLRGIEERLARARNNPAGDLRKLASLAPAVRRYTDFVTAARKPRYDAVALDRYRWMLEDCRLAVFCPDLAAREAGLPAPSRLTAAWADVGAL